MTSKQENVMVQIKYKDVEKTFSGNPQDVWLLTNKFLNQFLPSFEVANRLVLNIDLQKLVIDCENIIGLTEEGPCLLVSRNKLTDHETLSLLLLADYIGRQLSKTKKCGLSKEELQSKLGKDAKIASTRLGELVKNGTATKTADEIYKITTFGVIQVQKDILPRIKVKINRSIIGQVSRTDSHGGGRF